MEWIAFRVPVEVFEGYPEEVVKDWEIIERYIDSLEIQKAENEIRIMRQGLKDLNKAIFELKHPKK